jgi:L-ascorbate metabolism protein UlaG (beta-lactamase superfamily)
MLEDVHWLGHAGIKIKGSTVVYVDPYQIKGGEPADLVLVTHDHFDHLSLDDIERIRGAQTTVVLPSSAGQDVGARVERVKPGDRLTLAGVAITVLPAYNTNKQFHPKAAEQVGYIFAVDGISYYHSGDTDLIPEMAEVQADVAFLPVGGTYTMTAEEAARAAAMIKPKIAVPIHWGKIVGSEEDARLFQQECRCEVRILEPEA